MDVKEQLRNTIIKSVEYAGEVFINLQELDDDDFEILNGDASI